MAAERVIMLQSWCSSVSSETRIHLPEQMQFLFLFRGKKLSSVLFPQLQKVFGLFLKKDGVGADH